MSLKGAAFFAIIGTALWTVLTAVNFVRIVSAVASGIAPAVNLVTTLVQFVAALSLLVFVAAFYRSQG